MTTSPAFWTAIAAVITAVGGVVALFRHTRSASHKPPSN